MTPGIRPAGSANDDQARIITPEAALANGADYLVIGRPITAAADPVAALAAINRSLGNSCMKITMIGTGYVGLVTGTCLAEVGNDVLCLDVDARKIEILNGGGVPIHEPGLEAMIQRNVAAGRLHFTTDVDAAVAHGNVQFIAVGTPPDEDGSADMQYVLQAARNIGRRMTQWTIVVDKSTVPVGTADRVRAAIAEELAARGVDIPFAVVSNPEFLKEGAAVEDFMKPDRIVIGADDDAGDLDAAQRLRAVPAQPRAPAGDGRALGRAHQVRGQRDARDADLVHERAREPRRPTRRRHRGGAPGHRLRSADRLPLPLSGRRLRRQLLPQGREGAAVHRASATACRCGSSSAVEAVNEAQKQVLVDKIVAHLGADLTGRRFALWGLAFKPNTDDMREAPSRVIIDALVRRGATICAYDPVAMDEARRVLGDAPDVSFAANPIGRLRRRRRAGRRDRMEGVPQPGFRHAAQAAEAAADVRRPQSLRARACAPPGSSTSRSDGGERAAFDDGALLDWRARVAKARVLVVGDVMLDRYWFGDVERISPEAPVPVVRIARSEERPGGAANVARNAAALGAHTTLLSVDRRRRAGRRAGTLLATDHVRTSLPARCDADDDGQAARRRPAAAAVAHRLRDRAVAGAAGGEARRLSTRWSPTPTSSCCPTTARAGSRTSRR